MTEDQRWITCMHHAGRLTSEDARDALIKTGVTPRTAAEMVGLNKPAPATPRSIAPLLGALCGSH